MSRILTLNIGASKAVLAEYALSGKNRLQLITYGSGDLPAVDVNDPGSIGAALPSVLHQIMREKGIRPASLVVSLSGQMVFPRFAKFPPLNDADKLEQLVHYEIEQNVPFPIDEIVSDHQFLGTTPEGDKAAMIVAAKLEGVRAITDAVRATGLKPTLVDVSPVAICNALKFAYPQLDGCNVVLDIGSKTTNLIILENEKLYNRSIQVAGNTITKEIAQAFGCSFEEAETLKLERGYVSTGGVVEDEDEVTDQVSKTIRMVLTRLHAEISRSINFYRSQQGGSAPARLFLTGGTARLPQLAEFFSDSLQVEVEYLNPLAKVALSNKINTSALQSDVFTLTESVGLALHAADMAWITLDLMPPELINEARAIKRIPFLIFGGITLLAALAVAWQIECHGIEVANAQIECVEGRNSALKGLEAKLKASEQEVTEEYEKCDAFQQLMWQRAATLQQVKAIRDSLLPGMWITEWASQSASKDDPEAKPGVRVTIRGWRDAMSKIESDFVARNGQKNAKVVAEMVADKLRKSAMIAADTVKVVSQKEVKACLTEFAIQMDFADAPSVMPKAKARKGKAAQE